jgi:hypothetical protein
MTNYYMESSTSINFKERLKRLIDYQDVLARNSLLAHRNCDQGWLKYFLNLRIVNLLFFLNRI